MQRRWRVAGAIGLAAMLAAAGVVLIARAGESTELPRPTSARVSGNTWCGPLTRLAGGPVLGVYGELARYIDAGANVVAYSEVDGSETFVLCGRVRKSAEE